MCIRLRSRTRCFDHDRTSCLHLGGPSFSVGSGRSFCLSCGSFLSPERFDAGSLEARRFRGKGFLLCSQLYGSLCSAGCGRSIRSCAARAGSPGS